MNSAPLIGSVGVAMPVSKVISRTDVPLLTEHLRGNFSLCGGEPPGTIFWVRFAGMTVHASVILAAAAAKDGPFASVSAGWSRFVPLPALRAAQADISRQVTKRRINLRLIISAVSFLLLIPVHWKHDGLHAFSVKVYFAEASPF